MGIHASMVRIRLGSYNLRGSFCGMSGGEKKRRTNSDVTQTQYICALLMKIYAAVAASRRLARNKRDLALMSKFSCPGTVINTTQSQRPRFSRGGERSIH